MSIDKILNSLEISWKRDEILTKIKNGKSTDEIVDQFLINNKAYIKELNTLLRPEDIDLLNKVEILSTCEAKLINKIHNLNYLKNKDKDYKIKKEKLSLSNKVPSNKISLFMVNWIMVVILFLQKLRRNN